MASDRESNDRVGSIVFAAVIAAIAAAAVVMALGFPSRTAQELPLIVGIPLLGLALANLVAETRRAGRSDAGPREADPVAQALEELEDVEVNPGAFIDPNPDAEDALSVPMAFAAVGAFALLYLVFGQFVSIPLGIALLLRMTGQSWRSVVITAGATWAVIFTISTELNVQVHTGWIDLGELIGRIFGA